MLRKIKPKLPCTPLGWATAVALSLLIVVVAVSLTSGGRAGFVVADGLSLHDIIPSGSLVFVWPTHTVGDGRVVSAWAPDGVDDQEGPDDSKPTLVLKVYQGGKLVSTNVDQTVSNFEIRGAYIFHVPPLPFLKREVEEDVPAESLRAYGGVTEEARIDGAIVAQRRSMALNEFWDHAQLVGKSWKAESGEELAQLEVGVDPAGSTLFQVMLSSEAPAVIRAVRAKAGDTVTLVAEGVWEPGLKECAIPEGTTLVVLDIVTTAPTGALTIEAVRFK